MFKSGLPYQCRFRELELDEADREGLSLSIICLLSTGGQVKICLDLDGVEAQWLPQQYEFDDTHGGCRMWTFDPVKLFLDAGLSTCSAEKINPPLRGSSRCSLELEAEKLRASFLSFIDCSCNGVVHG